MKEIFGVISTAVNQTLRNAWNQHALSFPASRKRTLFAVFLIGAAALSVMFYPLWLAIGQRSQAVPLPQTARTREALRDRSENVTLL
jgi:uncharacterized membrane protein